MRSGRTAAVPASARHALALRHEAAAMAPPAPGCAGGPRSRLCCYRVFKGAVFVSRLGVRFVVTPSTPPLTPQFRAWLEDEHAWGRRALHGITRQRRLLLAETHGLERFTLRMALVNLTGSVARWANGLGDGLNNVGRAETAALFAITPPFAAADPTIDDCDQLAEYVEARMNAVHDLLAEDAP
jgi:hypothetical protein